MRREVAACYSPPIRRIAAAIGQAIGTPAEQLEFGGTVTTAERGDAA